MLSLSWRVKSGSFCLLLHPTREHLSAEAAPPTLDTAPSHPNLSMEEISYL